MVGFIVSVVGSLPLGYINLIAFEIYKTNGNHSLYYFLIGVVLVEFFVIRMTLYGAVWLLKNSKMVKSIELISILFLLVLAISFLWQSPSQNSTTPSGFISQYHPFLIGLFFNGINLIQLPFWAGWNLYLINEAWIDLKEGNKYAYILGTSMGTFCGILAFVYTFAFLLAHDQIATSPWIRYILPAVFLLLALLQIVKFVRKYRVE